MANKCWKMYLIKQALLLMLVSVLMSVVGMASSASAATLGPFRAPAIPLFTTDPYMQTWMMGDNTTAVRTRPREPTKESPRWRVRTPLCACGVHFG